MAGNAYNQAIRSNVFDIASASWPGVDYWTVNLTMGALWQRWIVAWEDINIYGRKSMDDYPDGLPGEEPPQWVKDFRALTPLIRKYPKESKEFADLCSQTAEIQADKVIFIGTVGLVPFVFIAKNNVGNTPTELPPGSGWSGNLAIYCQQMYFK
jgi:hypothetical protein